MEFWLIAAVLTIMFVVAFVLVHSIFVARTRLARRRAIMLPSPSDYVDELGFVYGTGALGLYSVSSRSWRSVSSMRDRRCCTFRSSRTGS